MTQTEKKSPPGGSNVKDYANALVAYALDHLPQFGEATAEMVAGLYAQTKHSARFVFDSKRSNEINESALWLDEDGHLVSVTNPERGNAAETFCMRGYQSYVVLSGPLTGKRFNQYTRPLPAAPVYRPGVVSGTTAGFSAA